MSTPKDRLFGRVAGILVVTGLALVLWSMCLGILSAEQLRLVAALFWGLIYPVSLLLVWISA